MIRAGEHISIFGLTGCGKSTLTRRVAECFPRRIVFDRLGEWEEGEVCSDFSEFRALYRERHEEEEFTVVMRPRPGIPPDGLVELADQVLALTYQVESYNRAGLAVIFEEVWLYAPLHGMPTWMQETLLTGRHQRISIIGNSQRPANVSKTLVSQSRHVFIGQFYEANDRKYYRETLGNRAEFSDPPEKFHFFWIRPDGPPQLVSTRR